MQKWRKIQKEQIYQVWFWLVQYFCFNRKKTKKTRSGNRKNFLKYLRMWISEKVKKLQTQYSRERKCILTSTWRYQAISKMLLKRVDKGATKNLSEVIKPFRVKVSVQWKRRVLYEGIDFRSLNLYGVYYIKWKTFLQSLNFLA